MTVSLYKKIIKEIEHQIDEGFLNEGDKLPSERELANQYQVSRNVVREAIKVLSEKGLVIVKFGKGAYVTTPSNDIITNNLENLMQKYDVNLENILEVREELEIMIIRKVVDRATKQNIADLKQINVDMEKAINQTNKFINLDYKFHMALAEATQNKIFYVLSNSFFDLSERLIIDVTRIINDISDRKRVQEQHNKLVQAIEEKDEEKAINIIRHHIATTKKLIKSVSNVNV